MRERVRWVVFTQKKLLSYVCAILAQFLLDDIRISKADIDEYTEKPMEVDLVTAQAETIDLIFTCN